MLLDAVFHTLYTASLFCRLIVGLLLVAGWLNVLGAVLGLVVRRTPSYHCATLVILVANPSHLVTMCSCAGARSVVRNCKGKK